MTPTDNKKINNNNKCNKFDNENDEVDDDSDTTTEEIDSDNEKDDIILEKQIIDNIKTLSLLKLRNDTPKSSPSTSRSSSFTSLATTNKTITTTTSTITPKKQQSKQHVHTQTKTNININTNTPRFHMKYIYIIMIIVLIMSISFINFQKTTTTTTTTIVDNNNDFKNLINKFKFTKEFEPFRVSLNSQISNNNLQLKQDVNYKRPISIHISTNNIDDTITYINNLFKDTSINSVNQFNDFSKKNHKNILQIINTKSNNNNINNNNHNSIFIFKINTSNSNNNNNDKIDLGFIEKILEGGTYNNESPSIKNLSMNNMFLVVSNIGQFKILNNTTTSTVPLDNDTKLEIVIKESKLKFAHRLVHRIRDTIIILFNN